MPNDPAYPRSAHLDLLRVGLRSRAETVADLAELAMRDEPSVRRDLGRLAEEGYVHLAEDRIRYRAPDEALSRVARRRVGQLAEEVTRRLAGLVMLAEELPRLTADWSAGGALLEGLDVEVFHGPEATVDLWHLMHSRSAVRHTDVVLPDAARLHVADPVMQRVWHDAIAQGRARVIVAADDASDPGARSRLDQELAGGVQIRQLAEPPGWFWVGDQDLVALPLVWGEAWPTSVMAFRSRAVAGVLTWLFERLWSSAVPVRAEGAGWESLLALMEDGATLEAASRALGISERTGRRRIAEAMEHFQVGSMLALGVAWGRSRPR